jgi:hypothetical protein
MMEQLRIYLTEHRSDPCGDYKEVWHTPPPDEGVKYRVISETWEGGSSTPWTTRHIYAIDLAA